MAYFTISPVPPKERPVLDSISFGLALTWKLSVRDMTSYTCSYDQIMLLP